MFALIEDFPSMTENCLLGVGVFEDDAVLLRLARSRWTEVVRPRVIDPTNLDDLVFELAQVTDAGTWEL